MGVAYLEINKLPCLQEIDIPKCMNVYLIYRTKLGVIGFFVLSFLICFYTPIFKLGRIMVYQCPTVRPFHMSRSNLRTPWPIHFKFHRVIGIDGLTVCILYGEISNFHSRVVGLYSSNCRRFFVCRAVN
jgi:hypothetical protein